jgi:hypothetical protein
VQKGYKEKTWGDQFSSAQEAVKKWTVGREPPFREDSSAEAEEFPLLEAVTTERLVKIQQAGKSLAGSVVIMDCGDYPWRCNSLYLSCRAGIMSIIFAVRIDIDVVLLSIRLCVLH